MGTILKGPAADKRRADAARAVSVTRSRLRPILIGSRNGIFYKKELLRQNGTFTMTFWISVALVGVLVFALGFLDLLRKFRRGDVRGRYLVAVVVAFMALATWAALSGLRPNAADSFVGLTMLAAALVAIVVIVREHQTLHFK